MPTDGLMIQDFVRVGHTIEISMVESRGLECYEVTLSARLGKASFTVIGSSLGAALREARRELDRRGGSEGWIGDISLFP